MKAFKELYNLVSCRFIIRGTSRRETVVSEKTDIVGSGENRYSVRG